MQITSSRNPKVKALRSLRLRKVRHREGHFLIEGIRIVEEALDCEAAVETLVYAPELLVCERAQALVERLESAQRLALSEDLFRTLSDRDEPQGIAAVVRIEDGSLSAIPLSENLLVIVAYQLSDPGNLGTLIRTADAAGATAVVVVEPSVDLYDPQTVRATMGSLFTLPVVRLEDPAALTHWVLQVRATGLSLQVVATSAHAQQVHFDADFRHPLLLLLGNERQGLPEAVRDQADLRIRLPMVGRATSLNVAAAGAALVYEVIRQRSYARKPDKSSEWHRPPFSSSGGGPIVG